MTGNCFFCNNICLKSADHNGRPGYRCSVCNLTYWVEMSPDNKLNIIQYKYLHNNITYYLHLDFILNETTIIKINKQQHSYIPEHIKIFDYLLDVTPQNLSSKMEKILTFL